MLTLLIAWVIYSLFLKKYTYLNEDAVLLAVALVVISLVPTFVYLNSMSGFKDIPLMPMHGIFYAMSFGLPALSNKTYWYFSFDLNVSYALKLTILGLVCLYVGYYLLGIFFKRNENKRSIYYPVNFEYRVGLKLFLLFSSFHVFPVLSKIPSLGQLSAPLGYLSLGILASLFFSKRLSRNQSYVFYLCCFYIFSVYLGSGSLAPLVLMMIFLCVIYWNIRRRVPILLVSLSIVLLIVLNPVKQNFRELTWYADNGNSSLLHKLGALSASVVSYYSDSRLSDLILDDSSTINRLAHVPIFGVVLRSTPDHVEYWSGETYRTLFTSFIPRFLWPGKPEATIGQEFGHRYALIGEYDYWTSINLPWLIEFYINFGVSGIAVGMILVGVFFRFLVTRFVINTESAFEHSLAVSLIFGLFYAESNLALMVGGLLSTYLSFRIMLFLLTRQIKFSRQII